MEIALIDQIPIPPPNRIEENAINNCKLETISKLNLRSTFKLLLYKNCKPKWFLKTSKVQTSEVQTSKVQTSKVQTSKVQTLKVQTSKVQTSNVQT